MPVCQGSVLSQSGRLMPKDKAPPKSPCDLVLGSSDTLCAVLERDTLSIRESRLFGAVVRWAEAECQRQQLPLTSVNKQKVLGKAISLIRFPLMTIEEFAAGNPRRTCLLIAQILLPAADLAAQAVIKRQFTTLLTNDKISVVFKT